MLYSFDLQDNLLRENLFIDHICLVVFFTELVGWFLHIILHLPLNIFFARLIILAHANLLLTFYN